MISLKSNSSKRKKMYTISILTKNIILEPKHLTPNIKEYVFSELKKNMREHAVLIPVLSFLLIVLFQWIISSIKIRLILHLW